MFIISNESIYTKSDYNFSISNQLMIELGKLSLEDIENIDLRAYSVSFVERNTDPGNPATAGMSLKAVGTALILEIEDQIFYRKNVGCKTTNSKVDVLEECNVWGG